MEEVLLLLFFLFACIVMSIFMYVVITVLRIYNFKNNRDAKRKKAEINQE